MADGTKIEWTDATWNPVTGCSVVSPGCTNCYAMRLAGTRLKHHASREGLTRLSKAGPVWTGEVRFNEAVLEQPKRWVRPRRIFVCAHGDLFHNGVQDAWLDRIFAVMAASPHHHFQVLTKRPERMRDYLRAVPKRINDWDCDSGLDFADFPLPNVWLGVSVEDQVRADERIPLLLDTPAAVRWLSMEPLLGPVDLTNVRFTCPTDEPPFNALGDTEVGEPIDWVVVGGESGPGARPMHPDWARSLRDQCAAADVPFLFKQWGEWLPGEIGHPDSDRGAAFVHWQDGEREYNGEHVDFTSETLSEYHPTDCPIEIDSDAQRLKNGSVRLSAERDRTLSATCARERCRKAGHCRSDEKAWLTVARKVGKGKAGRLLDGVQHDGFPS